VVGGSITLGSGSAMVTIPGYLAVAGVVHAVIVVGLMLRVGGGLPRNIAARNEAEANFRLGLMRVRENADSVALTHAEPGERAILRRGLDALVQRWMVVVRQDGQLTWILRGNGILVPVIPLLLAAPKYLSGELSLGAVMQIASAYVPFHTSMAWAVENFRALSNWHASARRVGALIQSVAELDADLDDPRKGAIRSDPSDDGSIHVEGLTVTDRHARVLVAAADLTVLPGEKLLVLGKSGSGKSALARAIVGLWPWGFGRVQLPRAARLSFVPQRAYLPLGSLRDALSYPQALLVADETAIVKALAGCGIGHLAPRLDSVERWDQLLSNGERQRLAFARLVLQRPSLVVLDDALGGLDADGQAALMALLRAELPDTTVLSVAQQEGGLAHFHDRTLSLVTTDGGSRLKGAAPRLVAVAAP